MINSVEMTKSVPGRYPSNTDSIGIELVGKSSLPPGVMPPAGATPQAVKRFIDERSVYEKATGAQNASLRWIVQQLCATLSIPGTEVHRHPEVSRKNPTEAESAVWK
jgi:hypothetical protein